MKRRATPLPAARSSHPLKVHAAPPTQLANTTRNLVSSIQTMRRAAGAAGALRRAWNEKGWRRSTLMFSIAAAVAFLANLGFTVWAITRGVTSGVGVIAEKECVEIRKLNAGVHVLVNALSTLLLAGSNYCMQLLSSPTRSLIDNAHKSRRWVDIGVSSVRNIFDSGNCAKRRLLWLLLGLSSLPLHLL